MSDAPTIADAKLTVQIEPLLVRRTDAARLLSISPRMFDDLVDAGLIPKVWIGTAVAYDPQELRAYVQKAKSDPGGTQAKLEKLRAPRKARRLAKTEPEAE